MLPEGERGGLIANSLELIAKIEYEDKDEDELSSC
jgi:hypothetical protein